MPLISTNPILWLKAYYRLAYIILSVLLFSKKIPQTFPPPVFLFEHFPKKQPTLKKSCVVGYFTIKTAFFPQYYCCILQKAYDCSIIAINAIFWKQKAAFIKKKKKTLHCAASDYCKKKKKKQLQFSCHCIFFL